MYTYVRARSKEKEGKKKVEYSYVNRVNVYNDAHTERRITYSHYDLYASRPHLELLQTVEIALLITK